jgi:hypothetical protein
VGRRPADGLRPGAGRSGAPGHAEARAGRAQRGGRGSGRGGEGGDPGGAARAKAAKEKGNRERHQCPHPSSRG